MIKDKLIKRKYKIRKKVIGNEAIPRMTVYKSLKALYVQLIDDQKGFTIASAKIKGKNIEDGVSLGKNIAELAKSKKINKIVFDRNGKKYHGVIKALADSARKAGLEF